jgi:hypothetical protein
MTFPYRKEHWSRWSYYNYYYCNYYYCYHYHHSHHNYEASQGPDAYFNDANDLKNVTFADDEGDNNENSQYT